MVEDDILFTKPLAGKGLIQRYFDLAEDVDSTSFCKSALNFNYFFKFRLQFKKC